MGLLALIFTSFLGCSFTSAKTTLELVQDLGVSKLEGSVTVYYSADSQTSDVKFTQKLVKDAIDFFATSPEINTHLEIYPAIFNQSDWLKMPMGQVVPYGIPSTSNDYPFVAFIGATDDNILAAFNMQMENLTATV